MKQPTIEKKQIHKAFLIMPLWHGLFFVIGLIIIIIVGVLVSLITGLSSADDQVFAIEALIAGLLAEVIIKKWFHMELYLFPKLNLRFTYAWIALVAYVFLFQPFE